ncbi:MAG: NUDIX hydrolase [Verrucomicrobiae bacterium]|nr:NUDIX hydrolase [Verrucomicrobiae bacterium]
MSDPEPWKLLREEPLADYRVFRVKRETTLSPRTQKEHDFFVIECPDWVNVIALTPAQEMVMVRQYRHGTKQVSLEIPGGMMDPHETDPVAAALRELVEETGYIGHRPRHIGAIHPNPAVQENSCHTILVEDCTLRSELQLDPGEDIRVCLVPAADIPALIANGTITHALTVVAYYYWLLKRG